MKATGSVKWFNDARGYGFLSRNDGSEDVFVHASDLNGRATLSEGDRVEFQIAPGRDNRPKAVEVQVIT